MILINKVLAFEPIVETYNKFKLNIKKNLREKQIEALNIALSNTNETKKMKSILKNNIMQSARYEISNNGNVDVIAKVFDDLYLYNNLIFDGKYYMDKVTDVFHSSTSHNEDQVPHLHVQDPDICISKSE